MSRNWTLTPLLSLLVLAGCDRSAIETPPKVVATPIYPTPTSPTETVVTADTDKDRLFAEFVREHSGGMIARAAIGLEKAGMLRLDLDRSATPEDVLEMSRILIQKARGEFPDRSINMALFDPGAQPILKARFRPGKGVYYQLVPTPLAGSSPGLTDSDRKFARRAFDLAGSFLSYLETDLDRHGRIWFGVAAGVEPKVIAERTRPILEKARKQFPIGDIRVIVFNGEGDPIGKAWVDLGGNIRWEP